MDDQSENDSSFITEIEKMLDSIFARCEPNKNCRYIQDPNSIPDLLQYLNSNSVPMSSKTYIIDTLIESFTKINHNMEIFSRYTDKENNYSLQMILIKLYLLTNSTNEQSENFLELIHSLLVLLLSNISFNKEVYKFTFDYLKNYMGLLNDNKFFKKENEKLNKTKFNKFLKVVQLLYGLENLKVVPCNYFYFSGENKINIESNKKLNIDKKNLVIFLCIKLNLDQTDNKSLFKHRETSLISIDLANEKSIKINLDMENNLLLNEKNICQLETNKWLNVLISFHKIKKKPPIEIFINQINVYREIPKSEVFTSELHSISLLKNFIGTASSIMIFQVDDDKQLNNILEFTNKANYKYGIYNEEIYTDILNTYKVMNEKDQSVELFINEKNRNSSNNNQELLRSIVKYLNCLYIPTFYEYKNDNPRCIILKDSFNDLDALLKFETENLNGVHVFNNQFENYELIEGSIGLLPIMEFMVNNGQFLECVENDTVSDSNYCDFFNIILSTLNNKAHNAQHTEKVHFFYLLSLFFERIPKKLFNSDILFNQLKNFSNELKKYPNINKEFTQYIFLNEKILFKYNFLKLKTLWKYIADIYLDNNVLKDILTVEKICNILLMYDRERYTKFCCQLHKEYFSVDGEVLDPGLDKRYDPFIPLLTLVINQNYDKKIHELYYLMTKDISPCTQFLLVKIFNDFYSMNRFKNKERNYSNFFSSEVISKMVNINLYVISKSLYDIRSTLINFTIDLLGIDCVDTNSKVNLDTDMQMFLENNLLPISMYVSNDYVNNSQTETINKNEGEILTHNEGNIDEIEKQKLSDNNEPESGNEENAIEKNNQQKTENDNLKNIPINDFLIIPEIKKVKFLDYEYTLTFSEKYKKLIIDYYDIDNLNMYHYKMLYILLNLLSISDKTSIAINCLIKLSVNSDILIAEKIIDKLLNNFDNIENNIDFKEFENYDVLMNETLENKRFFHWLLELSLQLFLFKGIENYTPGFIINYKSYNKREDLLEFIDSLLVKCFKLISFICTNKIYKLDYLLSWGYYYKNLYKCDQIYSEALINFIRSIFKELMLEIFAENITENEPELDKYTDYLFYYSQLFEFITFFKLKDIMIFNNDIENNKFIDLPLYYREGNILNQNERLDYHLIDKIFDVFKKVYSIEDYKDDYVNYYYEKFENYRDKYISEIKILIYTLHLKYQNSNLKIDVDKDVINKGIPLLQIIYVILCILLTESKDNENEFKKWIEKLETILLFVILSSNTYRIPKNEDEKMLYSDTQKLSKNIIFFSICLMIKYIIYYNNKQNTEMVKILVNLFAKIMKLCIKIFDSFVEKMNNLNKDNKKVNIMGILGNVSQEKDNIRTKSIYSLFTNKINLVDNNNMGFKNMKIPLEEIKVKVDDENEIDAILKLINDERFEDNFQKNQLLKNEIVQSLFIFSDCSNKRKNYMTNIIPIFDNNNIIKENNINLTKNDCIPSNEPNDNNIKLILNNNYIIKSSFEDKLNELIKKINDKINISLDLLSIDHEFHYYNKINIYKNYKNKLFSFNNLWSCNELFYTSRNKELKYKLVNHLTQDFSRILLTPILDILNYLPKFSQFDPSISMFYDDQYFKNIVNLNIENHIKEEDDIDLFLDNYKEDKEKDNALSNSNNKYHILYYINKECYKDQNLNATFYNHSQINPKEKFKLYLQAKYSVDKDKDNEIILECCLLKQQCHIKGFFFNNKDKIGFFAFDFNNENYQEEFDPDRHTCFGSIFVESHQNLKHYYIEIPYNEIECVLKRRYLFKKNSLEIFTINKKSYYFKFHDKQTCINVLGFIKHHLEKKTGNISIENSHIEQRIGFYNKQTKLNNNKNKNIFLSWADLYKEWSNWEISNLQILMFLNIYGNRSYNDLMQYHIAPWHLIDYKSENLNIDDGDIYRPFNVPIGMMELNDEGKERKNNYISHYNSMKNEEEIDKKPYFYGSHFSNSLYITHYLVRVFPFSYIKIELQGKNFDDPNRLFNDLPGSFECATTQKCDVRELIPEFFFFPEMYHNSNNLNLGKVKSKTNDFIRVNDITLPRWCKNGCINCPYKLTYYFRKSFEDTFVSDNINEWFDIIYGVKQRSAEIHNIYIEESYEEFEEYFDKLTNINDKMYSIRMVEFGVCPTKVLKYKPSKRLPYQTIRKNRSLDEGRLSAEKCNGNLDKEPICVKLYKNKNDYLIVCVSWDTIKHYSLFSKDEQKSLVYEIKNNEIKNGEIKNYKNRLIQQNKNMSNFAIYDDGYCVAIGGYFNGEICVKNLRATKDKNSSIKTKFYNNSFNWMVTVIKIDDNENFAFCGTTIGIVYIYLIDNVNKIQWTIYNELNSHNKEITDICVSDKLNIFCTCGKDGYASIYTLPKIKLINSFKIDLESNDNSEEIFAEKILISSSPLPCFIFYINNLNKYFNVFSINGHHLYHYELNNEIYSWKIFQNYKCEDCIIYTMKKSKRVIIKKVPYFNEPDNNYPIKEGKLIDLDISEDKSFAIIISSYKEKDKDYNLVYVLKDQETKI